MTDKGRPAQSLEPAHGVVPVRLTYNANNQSKEPLVRVRLTLADMLASALRHRVAFIIGGLSTFAFSTAIILSLHYRYKSEALLIVDPRQTNITNVQSIQEGEATLSDLNFVRSQMQILTSDENARHVVEDLKLQDDPAFAAPPSHLGDLLAPVWRLTGLGKNTAARRVSSTDAAVARYKQGFGAFSDGKSFIIIASFSAADPALAQRVLNRHLAMFQLEEIMTKRQAIVHAEKWFVSELQTLQAKLLASEARRQQFLQGNQLIRAGGETIPSRQLADTTNQLSEARLDLIRKQARYDELTNASSTGGEPDTAAVSSDLVQKLREQEASAAQRVAELEEHSGARNPALIAARAGLADLQGRIGREARRLQASAASDLAIARSNTRQLEVTLDEMNRKLASTSQDELTASQLNRDIEADRHLYDDLLLRFKQVSIQKELQEPDTRVVSAPTLPLEPAFPHRGLLLAVAAMAAAAVGGLVAFLIDMLSAGKTMSLRDIEASCGIAGLAVIPKLDSLESRLAALPQPGTHLSAALQTLKNSIAFRCNSTPKVTVFVSALPGDGKTLLATLYARSVAAEGQRVLLVDADLRRFGLTRITGTGTRNGLTDFLNGRPLADCIVPDKVEGLDVLPVGTPVVNPGAMFSADFVNRLLVGVGRSYTAVVIDTPPIAVVDDALHLVAQADATVLIARWNRTPFVAIHRALDRLSLAGGKLVGVAVTAADMQKYQSGIDTPKNFVKHSSYYISKA